jgi:hypothetical protein
MRPTRLALGLCLLAAPAFADTGRLTLMATGESLATAGFAAPALTKDGWRLHFDRVIATVADITAYRTDPPFAGDGPTITGAALPVPGVFTLDLADADATDRVTVATVSAPAGHYNALAWSLVPAPTGDFVGYALVFEGTATRAGETVAFTLATRDRHDYACGEYVGDERKGFVTPNGAAQLEMTLHLDHLFGRADRPAGDAMNRAALGFDRFAAGGKQVFALGHLHVGHVGEGHCHVAHG